VKRQRAEAWRSEILQVFWLRDNRPMKMSLLHGQVPDLGESRLGDIIRWLVNSGVICKRVAASYVLCGMDNGSSHPTVCIYNLTEAGLAMAVAEAEQRERERGTA
jgi:hypothetical protein